MKTENINLPESKIFEHFDKFVHLSMYAFLTFVFMWENYLRHKYHFLVSRIFLITAVVISLGISMELAQTLFTETRTGDYFDEIANFFGFLFGMILFNFSKKSLFLRDKVFGSLYKKEN